jgi:hypothetical protein
MLQHNRISSKYRTLHLLQSHSASWHKDKYSLQKWPYTTFAVWKITVYVTSEPAVTTYVYSQIPTLNMPGLSSVFIVWIQNDNICTCKALMFCSYIIQKSNFITAEPLFNICLGDELFLQIPSMEQWSSWEAKMSSVSQEISRTWWNLKHTAAIVHNFTAPLQLCIIMALFMQLKLEHVNTNSKLWLQSCVQTEFSCLKMLEKPKFRKLYIIYMEFWPGWKCIKRAIYMLIIWKHLVLNYSDLSCKEKIFLKRNILSGLHCSRKSLLHINRNVSHLPSSYCHTLFQHTTQCNL